MTGVTATGSQIVDPAPIGSVDAGDPPVFHIYAVARRLEDLGLQAGMFTPDEGRSLSDYPQMPAHTCFMSSRALAGVFPELVVVYGRLVAVSDRGWSFDVDHAWNTRGDGQIIDSTFRPADVEGTRWVYVPDSDGSVDR